jgi:hypothetical protein
MNNQSIDLLSECSLEQVAGGRRVIDCEGYAYTAQAVLHSAQNQTKIVLSSSACAGCNPDKH